MVKSTRKDPVRRPFRLLHGGTTASQDELEFKKVNYLHTISVNRGKPANPKESERLRSQDRDSIMRHESDYLMASQSS